MLLPSFLLEDTAKVELPPRGGRHLRPFLVGYFSNRYLSATIRGVGRSSSPTPRGEGRAESGGRQDKERRKVCCRLDLHHIYNYARVTHLDYMRTYNICTQPRSRQTTPPPYPTTFFPYPRFRSPPPNTTAPLQRTHHPHKLSNLAPRIE